jgi:hypothetical protein
VHNIDAHTARNRVDNDSFSNFAQRLQRVEPTRKVRLSTRRLLHDLGYPGLDFLGMNVVGDTGRTLVYRIIQQVMIDHAEMVVEVDDSLALAFLAGCFGLLRFDGIFLLLADARVVEVKDLEEHVGVVGISRGSLEERFSYRVSSSLMMVPHSALGSIARCWARAASVVANVVVRPFFDCGPALAC